MAPRIEFDLSFNLTKLPSIVYHIEEVKGEMEKKRVECAESVDNLY